MLATHPDISVLDEGVFKTDQLVTPEELGWPRMWCQVIEEVRLTAEDHRADPDALKRDWSPFFDHRKPVFLEKSVVNSARMLWLQKHFPNAYFVAIVRNGYAVAEGIRRKAARSKWNRRLDSRDTYPIELCAEQWKVNNEIIEMDAPFIRNFRMIYYEDLCKEPRRICEELWDFIGLSNYPDWSEDKIWKVHGRLSEVKNMNYESMERLRAEEIDKIKSVAGRLLNRHGYFAVTQEDETKRQELF